MTLTDYAMKFSAPPHFLLPVIALKHSSHRTLTSLSQDSSVMATKAVTVFGAAPVAEKARARSRL